MESGGARVGVEGFEEKGGGGKRSEIRGDS